MNADRSPFFALFRVHPRPRRAVVSRYSRKSRQSRAGYIRGGYNQALLTNEDYEFATRVRQSGGRVWFDPRLRCEYFARPTFAELARQYWRYGWWKAQMLRRYPRSLRWRQAVPILWSALGPLLSLASPWPPIGWLAVSLWAVYGALVVAAALQQTGLRRLRIAALLMLAYVIIHFAWGWGAWSGWLSLRRMGE
jgi:hypothetical protein